jgi:hypothetical protein
MCHGLQARAGASPRIDADCAKTFDADQAGFNVYLGFSHGETFRVVQLTPPGSACSIAIALGVGVVDTAAASIQGLHLVVDDIHTARKQLIERGVDVGGVQDTTAPGKQSPTRPSPTRTAMAGPFRKQTFSSPRSGASPGPALPLRSRRAGPAGTFPVRGRPASTAGAIAIPWPGCGELSALGSGSRQQHRGASGFAHYEGPELGGAHVHGIRVMLRQPFR